MMKLKEKLINFKRKDAQKSDINLLTVADLKKAKREISTALRCGSFSEKSLEKSTRAAMMRIIITFRNQVFL